MPLNAFPNLPKATLLHLAQVVGSFATSLDLSGNRILTYPLFDELTSHLGYSSTQLTSLNLRGCTFLVTPCLHALLERSPHLQDLCVRGLKAVTNTTCALLADGCLQLESLDIRQCTGMDAEGIYMMASNAQKYDRVLQLKSLFASGLKYVDDQTMALLGERAPFLEVLDLSYSRHLHNSALDAYVACDVDMEEDGTTILLHASDVGRDATAGGPRRYRRRVLKLRHLNLSFCRLLTDDVCSNLAHSVPDLEYLELAGLGDDLKDGGLCRLLATTPKITRLDLEDASSLTDDTLAALTPPSSSTAKVDWAQVPGNALERLIISHVGLVTDGAVQLLIRRCKHLTALEADNTRLSGATLQLFVRKARKRQIVDARASFVDCRGVLESLIKEISSTTRPRLGWRSYDARHMMYVDGRDEDIDALNAEGQDECDENRVVVKSYYSWQNVDAVAAAREKRKAARRKLSLATSVGLEGAGRGKWWTPIGGRRSGRNESPPLTDVSNGEGCTIM
jgi:F-box and leucine-rich repeat protein 2/20